MELDQLKRREFITLLGDTYNSDFMGIFPTVV